MPAEPTLRPDADEVLKRVQRAEAQAGRGRLRIYFGASAGVGKTYAMLVQAQKLAAGGRDVVVGIVETHGRTDTAMLLRGLEVHPLREIRYRDRTLGEFDLDGILARRPALVLVDELAHSNVPGSRHPKRWQDITELLSVGIDVFTTLNVQHLESLNDVVGGITGIRVWETVPDKVFDDADEVVLVDIPAEELIARLEAGKVYLPEQADRAASNFFRRGNLMALREIALRRTADRVEEDVQAYRSDRAISPVWKTEAAVLACIGPAAPDIGVARSAARLANQLAVPWHAIYVETPPLQRLPDIERERILKTLKLAESLGAKTAVLSAPSIVEAVIEYSRKHNLSKLVLGRPPKRWRPPWARRTHAEIGRLAPDIDVLEVGIAQGGDQHRAARAAFDLDGEPAKARRMRRYGYAAAACLLTALVAAPLRHHFDLANIVMLFLLAVVVSGVKWGRGPAVSAAFLSVALFDFLFVPPRLSFAVTDVQYLLTFAVMLIVALVTGQLAGGARFQARVAARREERARALYEFARELSGALLPEQVTDISDAALRRTFGSDVRIVLPDADDRLVVDDADAPFPIDAGIAQWAFDKAQAAGAGTDTLPGTDVLYVPLRAPMRTRGVLAIRAHREQLLLLPEQRQLLDTFATLTAIALERVHYIEVAQQALIQIESERLRNSLLAALSHDLRTPLAALVGLADVLQRQGETLPAATRELATAIRDSAMNMSALVNNMLDMARLQSGQVKLRLEWQPLEEVVGSALRETARLLADHHIEIAMPSDLPFARFDAALVERVLVNLLENAAKYTPRGATVRIAAEVAGNALTVTVSDDGPGVPAGQEEAIFEQFVRGEKESATPGVGLGLAICRAIVTAHRGHIVAANPPGGGARFTFTLPLEAMPAALDAPEDDGVEPAAAAPP